MKQKKGTLPYFQSMSRNRLSLLTGGNKKESDEYITVIINGVAYRIRINKNGVPTSPPEEII